MDIKINDELFSKDSLIKLIAKNKLQAIIHLRAMANIGLKDAKEIVENLEENPNYYDNVIIKIAEKDFDEAESMTVDVNNSTGNMIDIKEKKVGSHIIKYKNKNTKWVFLLVCIFIVIWLCFFMKR